MSNADAKIVHYDDINFNYLDFNSFLGKKRNSNSAELNKMKKLIFNVVSSELTDRQRECFMQYFLNGLKMKEIAENQGVAPSTVTRHIKSARAKVMNIAKYYI